MFSSKSGNGRDGFTILYRRLGTISTKELLAALIADLKAIQEDYGVAYITGGHLKLYVTDDKGRDVPVRRNRRGRARACNLILITTDQSVRTTSFNGLSQSKAERKGEVQRESANLH